MRLVLAALVVVVMGCAIAGVGMGEAPAEREPRRRRPGVQAARQRIAALGPQGRRLFEDEGCDRCHSIAAVDADGRLGPRLDMLDDDAEDVAESITDPRDDTADGYPEKLMPADYARAHDRRRDPRAGGVRRRRVGRRGQDNDDDRVAVAAAGAAARTERRACDAPRRTRRRGDHEAVNQSSRTLPASGGSTRVRTGELANWPRWRPKPAAPCALAGPARSCVRRFHRRGARRCGVRFAMTEIIARHRTRSFDRRRKSAARDWTRCRVRSEHLLQSRVSALKQRGVAASDKPYMPRSLPRPAAVVLLAVPRARRVLALHGAQAARRAAVQAADAQAQGAAGAR